MVITDFLEKNARFHGPGTLRSVLLCRYCSGEPGSAGLDQICTVAIFYQTGAYGSSPSVEWFSASLYHAGSVQNGRRE